MAKVDLSVAIGGAAGQGIATPGDILARIFVRRGLHLNAYMRTSRLFGAGIFSSRFGPAMSPCSASAIS